MTSRLKNLESIMPEDFSGIYDKIIIGTSDGDVIHSADDNASFVTSLGGNDTIWLGAGGSLRLNAVLAGDGNDKVHGGAADDYVLAGAGNDSVSGGAGNDVVFGLAGNDHLVAGEGTDSLYGGSGNDYLDGSDEGTDRVAGGTGSDVYWNFGKLVDTIIFDIRGEDHYVLSNYADTVISDFGGSDALFVMEMVDSLTFTRSGNDLVIDTAASVEIDNFFKSGHAIEYLDTADGSYSLEYLSGMKDGESVSGDHYF